MMQSAESLVRHDAAGGCGLSSPGRRFFPESKMRAILVIVADVLREQPFQMPFVHRNDLIQQIASAAFDPALRHTVLPRALEGGSDGLDLQGSHSRGNLKSILPVPVEDQKPGSRSEWERFPQLLNGPQAGWVLGHVEVQDAPTVVADDEEAVEHAERDRRNGEEIHCGDRFPMVAQKREPTLGRLGVPRRSSHPTGNGSLRDIKTQHEELAVDARRSQSWILGHHSEDQLANFFRSLSSSDRLPHFRNQSPVQPEADSVPADERFRRDNDERLLPLRPEPTDGNPEKLVQEAEAAPRMSALQNGELLAKNQVLQNYAPTATEQTEERSEPEQKQAEHESEL